MKKFPSIILALAILITVTAPTAAFAASVDLSQGDSFTGARTIYPTFAITAVAHNNYVSVLTEYLPANQDFVVTMGYMGTAGIGGYIVKTINSGAGGQLALTFNIPAALYNQHQISIRMVSIQSGYYAYNWFYNYDANVPETSPPDSSPPAPSTTYYGFPTFSIVKVVEDARVKISGTNFPPNDTFLVRMNWMYTRGIAGTIVETVTTDANGVLSDLKYDIPSYLGIANRIAIRLESPTTGYYAYNWFYNNDAP